jgi:hypothetical protein
MSGVISPVPHRHRDASFYEQHSVKHWADFEGAIAYFKKASQNFPRDNEEMHENFGHYSLSLT